MAGNDNTPEGGPIRIHWRDPPLPVSPWRPLKPALLAGAMGLVAMGAFHWAWWNVRTYPDLAASDARHRAEYFAAGVMFAVAAVVLLGAALVGAWCARPCDGRRRAVLAGASLLLGAAGVSLVLHLCL